jgi:hypothetical protein
MCIGSLLKHDLAFPGIESCMRSIAGKAVDRLCRFSLSARLPLAIRNRNNACRAFQIAWAWHSGLVDYTWSACRLVLACCFWTA